MSIWFKDVSVEDLNRVRTHTMIEFIGIKFIEVGDDFLTATMPVNEKTKQPIGILHGGANMVLAETAASAAANAVVDANQFYCVGLEINANHIRAVKQGLVTAIATPIHLGRTTQVWQINIFDEAGKKNCVSRMTAAVIAW